MMEVLLVYLFYAIVINIFLRRAGFRSNADLAQVVAQDVAQPLRVLVIGATGGTGRELVAQALERGHSVTALVRKPSKLQIKHPQLKVMQGDVLDYASIDAAVPGHDIVVSALGHKRYYFPGHILSEGTRNLLRSMESHGVQRFVCETSLGIGDSAGRMGLYYTLFTIPVILPLYFSDKCRQEKLIAASGLDWVIVRPGVLTNGPKKPYRHGVGIGSFIWTVRISRSSVAGFMLDQLTDNRYLRQAIGVCRK